MAPSRGFTLLVAVILATLDLSTFTDADNKEEQRLRRRYNTTPSIIWSFLSKPHADIESRSNNHDSPIVNEFAFKTKYLGSRIKKRSATIKGQRLQQKDLVVDMRQEKKEQQDLVVDMRQEQKKQRDLVVDMRQEHEQRDLVVDMGKKVKREDLADDNDQTLQETAQNQHISPDISDHTKSHSKTPLSSHKAQNTKSAPTTTQKINNILTSALNIQQKPSDDTTTDSDSKSKLRKPSQELEETSQPLIKTLCNNTEKHGTECYKHGLSKCTCNGRLADCSGKPHVPNISYAPKLRKDMICLKFAYNNIRYMSDSYFANVSHFVVVDLSSNALVTISAKTFGRFTNLKYLILNKNTLSYTTLKPVLAHPPALRLDLVATGLGEIPKDYFYRFWNILTGEIYMDYNFFPTLDLREFARLDNLRTLSLRYCSIQNVITGHMGRLDLLDLRFNNISTFPVTCNNSFACYIIKTDYKHHDSQTLMSLGTSEESTEQVKNMTTKEDAVSLFPVLTVLDMGSNYLLSLPLPDQICLPNLRYLDLGSNNITEIPDSAFISLRSLKSLHLNKIRPAIKKIGTNAFNIAGLTSLYLSRSNIRFSSPDVSPDILQGCSRLTDLRIDHNFLGDMPDLKFQRMLSHVPEIKYLTLGSTQIQNIPVKVFSQLVKLEMLYLYINSIVEIPAGAFDTMQSLQFLYLDQNHIQTISEKAFSFATRQKFKKIDISKNTYMCNCNLLWFKSWLNEAGPSLFAYYDSYNCSNFYNQSVQGFELSRQACLFSQQVYILFVAFLTILILSSIAFAVLYRYRWKIRLLMYERRSAAKTNSLLDEREYTYDLFVVYCNDNREWVKELVEYLEEHWKLKVCIHERDFIAGNSIINNIHESMNASKRILVILSSRFAITRWCKFELEMCQTHIIDHDLESLLVILLDKIEQRDMSAVMYALYNNTCFLEAPSWDETSNEKITSFWRRLRDLLKPLIDTRNHATSVKMID